MKLTEKQKKFCDYYIETGNAMASAEKAGYSKNYSKAQSHKLLENVGIKARIDGKLAELQDARTASAKEVLEFLTSSLRGEVEEEVVVVEGEGDGVSVARKIKKQIGLKDRIKAAELLGKRYRLYTDKVEVEGVLPVMIVGEDELEE